MTQLEFHPLSAIFPLIEGNEFDELVADIRAHGLRCPIILHTDGRILDGRNRYLACLQATAEPRFETWDGVGLAADFVQSLNGPRRHLDAGTKKIAAGKYAIAREEEAKERSGLRTDLVTSARNLAEVDFGRSREKAAEKFGVSDFTVDRAVKVVKDGAAELVNAVERGKVSVSAAADIATKPKEEQREIVARGEKEILEAAKAIRAEKAVVRREERLEKLAEISKGNAELNTAQRYPVIYADPPWQYENPPIGASNRSIENHYPTMTMEELLALPVAELATEDAILYIWATAPKLAECIDLLRAWGFEYRTNATWDKEVIGMGYHFRNQHELLLVGKRGSIPPPQAGTQPSSVYRERRTEHSAKPIFYYEMIEAAYPQLPKIELFCRSPRSGWSVWGNQANVAC